MRAIRVTFLELNKYKTTFKQYERASEQMTAGAREQAAVEVLSKIVDQCSGADSNAAEEAQQMVLLQVAPRFGLTLPVAN